MDLTHFMTTIPSWLLFLLAIVVGILAAELGAAIEAKREQKSPTDKSNPVGSLVGATLGLLAFMLGLTFSITSSRYNDRKHLVIEQANAIGTCYLRTSLLPEKQKVETRRLFGEYIDMLAGITNAKDIHANVTKMEGIQMQIWRQASSLKDENMDGPMRALYIASLNEVIDYFGERKTVVLTFRIPGSIWLVLLMLYLLNMFLVGSEASSNTKRRRFNVPIMTAAFSLVVVLIAAMDASTKEGQFTVSRQPLIDVQKMIHEENSTMFKVR